MHVVNVEQIPRDQTDTVDVELYLTPANKYSLRQILKAVSTVVTALI
jgi:hypothetical protein